MKPAKIREMFERFEKANPHPATELEYRTPFELLVAVILSAQVGSASRCSHAKVRTLSLFHLMARVSRAMANTRAAERFSKKHTRCLSCATRSVMAAIR